jgi:hypothetical protein
MWQDTMEPWQIPVFWQILDFSIAQFLMTFSWIFGYDHIFHLLFIKENLSLIINQVLINKTPKNKK